MTGFSSQHLFNFITLIQTPSNSVGRYRLASRRSRCDLLDRRRLGRVRGRLSRRGLTLTKG